MNGKIDVIVPWCNTNDKVWINSFNLYKQKETGIKSSNRFRDWDSFKYFFRGIEKNCKFVNKVFLVLASESQIPDWLDVNCKKLRIVFHDEYIPKEFLPTFNSNVIELFYHNIPDLSENFILCNDDMYIVENINENYFFDNNRPISPLRILGYGLKEVNEEFDNTINNNIKILNKECGKMVFCHHFHHPLPYNKNFWTFVWKRHQNEIINSLTNSRFRKGKNLSHWLIDDLQKISKFAITDKNIYSNAMYLSNCNGKTFNKFDGKNMICFNDCDKQDKYDFEFVKSQFTKYMNKRLPEKSSFEK